MQNQEVLPANQEPEENPKKTWQEPELVNLNVMTGAYLSANESTFLNVHS